LVYIDGEQNRFGRMKMCHMLADTPQELKTMALQIGLSLRWFQAAASCPHFDVSKGKRELAVAAGAVQCDRRQIVAVMKRVRQTWPVENGRWVL
jgi:hypothetical protein